MDICIQSYPLDLLFLNNIASSLVAFAARNFSRSKVLVTTWKTFQSQDSQIISVIWDQIDIHWKTNQVDLLYFHSIPVYLFGCSVLCSIRVGFLPTEEEFPEGLLTKHSNSSIFYCFYWLATWWRLVGGACIGVIKMYTHVTRLTINIYCPGHLVGEAHKPTLKISHSNQHWDDLFHSYYDTTHIFQFYYWR